MFFDVAGELIVVAFEGVAPGQQVIHNYADAPDVDFLVVGPGLPNFGRHVDGSAAVGDEHFLGDDLTDAKIREFEHGIRALSGHQ